jgi:glycosyltransferase involved in cell wall biosynthesis
MTGKPCRDSYGGFEVLGARRSGEPPAVSVVMSVLDGERYLAAGARSIREQTFADWEFLVVNDGSNDGTLELLLAMQREDPRLVVVNQPNLGLTKSLNRAIGIAAGRYIARQDVDDVSLPGRLAAQVEFLDGHPECFLVGTRFSVIDEDGRDLGPPRRPPPETHEEILRVIAKWNPFFHASVMFRNDGARVGGFYDAGYRYAQDYEFWLRIAARCRVHNLPEALACRRRSPSTLSERNFKGQRSCMLRAKWRWKRLGWWRPSVWATMGKDLAVVALPLWTRRAWLRLTGRPST